MRNPDTYRQPRRDAWYAIRQNPGAISWPVFNANLAHWGFDIGGRKTNRRGLATMTGFLPTETRSKYMPHNGKREMERRRNRLAA